jgi:hypothetical protein
MGITSLSLDRVNRYLKPNDSILIIGCQNLYNAENYGQVAHTFFEKAGHTVRSLDILGCQGSEQLDLREDLKFSPDFDMVTDFGSKEHIDGGLYQPFKNMHDACRIGGVMIHENPRYGHWPLHGQHYFSEEFYIELATQCRYQILELCEEGAMSNWTTGVNVCCVLIKQEEKFIEKEEFDLIYNMYIKSE